MMRMHVNETPLDDGKGVVVFLQHVKSTINIIQNLYFLTSGAMVHMLLTFSRCCYTQEYLNNKLASVLLIKLSNSRGTTLWQW